jgi:hypothetical protein
LPALPVLDWLGRRLAAKTGTPSIETLVFRCLERLPGDQSWATNLRGRESPDIGWRLMECGLVSGMFAIAGAESGSP